MKKEELKKEILEEQGGSKQKELEKIKRFEKNPLTFLIRKSKLTILIIISLIIFGVVTIESLPKELNPEVEIPVAVVVTVYPGASPLDVEQQVTNEIESEISDLTGIDKLSSSSSLGFSSITVEFNPDQDLDDSISELKDKVDNARVNLPEDANDPRVVEVNISDTPVVEATLTSDKYDLSELNNFAENIENRVKGVPFVSDVNIVGGRERVVKIDVDQEKLSQFGISINSVVGTLKANNVNFPIGSIEIDNSKYNIRVEGEFEDSFEVASLIVGNTNEGRTVYLEDVAEVYSGFSEAQTSSRFSANGAEPTSAISLQVYKKTGGDITSLAREVATRIEEGKGSLYPEDVQVVITNDFSEYVTDSINTLTRNGIATVILILILLFMFLGWKEALLAGPAVPFSFFIAFIVMAFVGESINNISLFALVLSLGLLVDSAIVVVEGIYNKVSRYGFSGYQSAISTIEEYSGPLVSGMMTTVAAFFPLLFVKGIFGEFMRSIPVVVIATLFAGLFVSLSIIPALAVYLINPVKAKDKSKNGKHKDEEKVNFLLTPWKKFRQKFHSKPRNERVTYRIFDKISAYYCLWIPRILESKKARRWVIFGAWGMFFVSLLLPISGFLKVQSFGEDDSDFFYLNLELPNGTTLEKTGEVAEKIENRLRENEYVVNFVTNLGASIGAEGSSSSGEGSSNKAFIQVNLIPEEDRDELASAIVDDFRKKIQPEIAEGEVTFVEASAGPPAGSPIELRVIGEDLLILEETAEKIKEQIEAMPGAIEVQTSADLSPGELVFKPNKELIVSNGLSVAGISAMLRAGVSGDDSVEITKNGEEIALAVGYPEARLNSTDEIKDVIINAPNGKTFALSQLGEFSFEPALASIRHRDSDRVVTITGKIAEGGNLGEVNQQIQQMVNEMAIPSGYSVAFGGEAQELQEVYTDMLVKMLLGIVLILFILVLQFNSYKQTLIILFTIPLAMIGVFWGMAIFRLTLDIPAFIGIVSLAGIVVNNAIILIDQINREIKEEGKNLVAAAQNAGCVRMRPIFLTTITTVVGLLPLSLSEPIWRNLGFAVIFGLTFSAFLTLVMVPVMYVSLYKERDLRLKK